MGKHAPRRGSIAAKPLKRAASMNARVKCWPTGKGLLGFGGYKAGMAHVVMVDDSESPTKGQEVTMPVTILEVPPVFVYSIVAYGNEIAGKRIICEVAAHGAPKEISRSIVAAKKAGDAKKLDSMLPKISEVRVKVCAMPSRAGFGKKTPEVFEIAVGGANAAEQLEYAKSILGKEVKAQDAIPEGEYVDVIGVTKGKGWQGIVKRFGVALGPRKATQARRHGGSIGAETPAKIFYTIPRAGQMGFHRRTDKNKRILKYSPAKEASRPGGFPAYGVPAGECLVMEGSVMGPAKRFLKFRKTMSGKKAKKPAIKQLIW